MGIQTRPWLDFANSLMSDFAAQFGNQSAIYQYLSGVLKPMIEGGGQGFSNPAMAAMRTGASDTIANQFTNATKAVQNNTQQDAGLPSGVQQQLKEQLSASAAGAQSNAQNNITLANEEQRLNNQRWATGEMMGIASGYNPLGYAGVTNQSGDTLANIENANTQQDANSFFGSHGLFAGLMSDAAYASHK